MTLTDLHTAVMASPGPLEDELMAEIWCIVHGIEYDNAEWDSDEKGLWKRNEGGKLDPSWWTDERPDVSTDAALELMRVRFPEAVWDAALLPDDTYRFRIGTRRSEYIYSGEHTDFRLAIIAALLKAMGG